MDNEIPSTSYAIERLAIIGMTLKDTEVTQWIHDDDPSPRTVPLVRADAEDNMCFAYAGLDGKLQSYMKARKEVHYEVIRLKEPRGDRKYINPEGTESRIFFTPQALAVYNAEAPALETLFVVEGQLKALSMSFYGAVAVGISGIWNFKEGKGLKDDLEDYIRRVKPKRICLFFDRDAREITRKAVEQGRDLAERLRQFYSAVTVFREAAQAIRTEDWEGSEIYYGQVAVGQPTKGVDDLLVTIPEEKKRRDLMRELAALNPKRKEFFLKNLSQEGPAKLKQFFLLDKVQRFYEEFAELIEQEEFCWRGGRFQADAEGVVKEKQHPEATSYIRVSSNYYKVIYGPNAFGQSIMTLVNWQKSEIKQDYGDKFIKQIQKFDKFTNIPHLPQQQYQREIVHEEGDKIFRHYNRYNPLPHLPHPGPWPTIDMFLKHIFRDQYEMGLDWIQVLYLHPTHKLPIICLVAEEKSTGKSTFLELMNMIFGGNATMIGNEDFSGDFNSHFVDKLFVGIDEGLIEKQSAIESIKRMATAKTIGLHSKGKDKSDVDCLLHFAMTSNNVNNFLRIDAKENRFWVRLVSPFEGPEIPDQEMKDLLREEIPAFLHHLLHRTMHYKQSMTRFWFPYEAYRTAALENVVQHSRSALDKALDETIERLALEKGQMLFHMTAREMIDALKQDSGQAFAQGWVAKTLTDKFGKNITSRQDIAVGWRKVEGMNVPCLFEERVGRFFAIDVAKWYNEADTEKIRQLLRPALEPTEVLLTPPAEPAPAPTPIHTDPALPEILPEGKVPF